MQNGTIVVGGSLAQRPGHGGHAWVFLQYLLGFRRLGWDVLFVDRLEPDMGVTRETAIEWLTVVMTPFGLDNAWVLLSDDGREVINSTRTELAARTRDAALILNVMGFINDEGILSAPARRVFLDIDPGFGQMWQALGLHDMFVGHDVYVTIGENIGKPDCTIPTCGLRWVTTKQPVVLDEWIVTDGPPRRFTSIASWRGPFGPIDYQGETYGLRAHEFRRFAQLPLLVDAEFEVALDIDDADERDIKLLRGNGWRLAKPRDAVPNPQTYRSYIAGSGAELMVAKNMYVRSRSGWFSDRSICYLAAGRPVLAQDTGLLDLLSTGEGLLLFDTLDDAVAGVVEIKDNYEAHAAAARDVAEAHFASDAVLTGLLRNIGVT